VKPRVAPEVADVRPVQPTADVELESETLKDIETMTPQERQALLRKLEARRGGSLLRLVEDEVAD